MVEVGVLGTELKLARTAVGLSQTELADKAGVSRLTVRQAERSEGRYDSFTKLASALGLTVGSRTPLPSADTIGEQLATYRIRLGQVSQRGLAAAADITPSTAAAVEQGRIGHLAALEAVARVLGVVLCLEKSGRAKSFFTESAASSSHECWTTPIWVLERLYAVVGGEFCLDPCSPTKDRTRAPVRAKRYFTKEEDGLSRPWKGKVFMNPPYGRSISDWVAKAAAEATSGRAEPVIALVPARVDTSWWHNSVVAAGASVTMFRGRLAFGGEGGTTAPFPSALVLWSRDEEHAERLRVEFPDAWHIRGTQPDPVHRIKANDAAEMAR
jgi:phage N-6-adenine-methyltransferase